MKRVLVTGAGGFVGRHLCPILMKNGFSVRAALRDETSSVPSGVECMVVGNIGPKTDWTTALSGVNHVIHLAAMVHVMKSNVDSEIKFQSVNTEGTKNLIRASVEAGVERFVFLSSVKVMGENTIGRNPFTEKDKPHPKDAYARSKLDAENVIWEAVRGTQTVATVLRPPLVYGPGVGANFQRMVRLIKKGFPLPLASVQNSRSLISVTNLSDAIKTILLAGSRKDGTYFISDGEDVSTADLVRRLSRFMGLPERLWPCPSTILKTIASIVGKKAESDRVLGSLQVSNASFCRDMDWTAPETLDEGLAGTVKEINEKSTSKT